MQNPEPARREEPFFQHIKTGDDFESALRVAVSQNARSMTDLHCAIRSCVRNLRSEGMVCEAVLLTMKSCVKHLERKRFPDGTSIPPRSEFVMEQIVRWSISEFYLDD